MRNQVNRHTIGHVVCFRQRRDGVHRAKTARGPLAPAPRDTLPKGFAVPGWTDEQTRPMRVSGVNAAAAGDDRKAAQVGVPMM